MKIPCTVGILTKNSAAGLGRALESVKDFEEILICDGGSTDETLAIANKYGAKIIPQDKEFLDAEGYIMNFSGVRNQAFHAAQNDWFFYVDSDEYASPELVEAIRSVVETRREGVFSVFRRYILNGEEVTCCTTYPNRSQRFFSKKSVVGFRKVVHERPELREGVSPEDISAKLFVPVSSDRAGVWRRNDRYIELEVTRKGRVGLFKFLGYARIELKTSALLLARLINVTLFCRGKKLPMSMEFARHRYTLKLLSAIWRARSRPYPPHVLFLINKWKTGGAEHVFQQEYEALSDQGVLSSFGCVYGTEVPVEIAPQNSVQPQFKSLYDVAAYIRLLRLVGERGITHIVATLEHANIVARIAAICAPRVKVVVIESGMADRKPWRYKILDLLLNWRAQAIVAGSSGVLKSLGYQSIYAKKQKILLNGVAVPDKMPARSEPHLFTLLAVGSLRSEKAFDILLDAFADFSKSNEARLLIAGKGPLEFELKQRAEELGVAEKVEFLGEVVHDEVLKRYSAVHCFALSSVSEGNPTVVMEAMAAGTPVIATRVSGVTDYVEQEVSGLLVPPGNSLALASAMKKLFENSALRHSIGKGGYACAKEKLSLESHIKGLKHILRI